ncbi:hypothetical protein BGZ65_012491, partial [Modicella reniformis]
TETIVKIHHPDGSIEETVTRENHGQQDGYGSNHWSHQQPRRHGGRQHRLESDEDGERDSVAAIVAEAMATEKLASQQQQQQEQASENSRNWPPKAWIRRQKRDE